mmetsp:Transcript_112570/g.317949  ORF Transcript_112570/g.317949 Transcript_112570/m.317949 type:complete len:326 (-) Transcript_112570:175-1152(-)
MCSASAQPPASPIPTPSRSTCLSLEHFEAADMSSAAPSSQIPFEQTEIFSKLLLADICRARATTPSGPIWLLLSRRCVRKWQAATVPPRADAPTSPARLLSKLRRSKKVHFANAAARGTMPASPILLSSNSSAVRLEHCGSTSASSCAPRFEMPLQPRYKLLRQRQSGNARVKCMIFAVGHCRSCRNKASTDAIMSANVLSYALQTMETSSKSEKTLSSNSSKKASGVSGGLRPTVQTISVASQEVHVLGRIKPRSSMFDPCGFMWPAARSNVGQPLCENGVRRSHFPSGTFVSSHTSVHWCAYHRWTCSKACRNMRSSCAVRGS